MHIEIKGLEKTFREVVAVQELHVTVEKGTFLGLLGPSGGGKTTILRMLAGLEKPTAGEIFFDGRDVADLPPQQRGIGFVFQNYALFKHMTVFDNIAFGLRVQKWSKKQIAERVHELLELTGLTGTERRFPHQLSGGQRQRVAFARALAPEPQLLLLDEPFAAIDAQVRKELRTWLRGMITQLGITSIFVTHDQEEAVEVADEIMIVNQGRLEQKGTPWEIYKQPATPFVAAFIGETHGLDDVAALSAFLGEERALQWRGLRAMVRPEAVEVGRAHEWSPEVGTDWGVVKHVQFRGNSWQVDVEIGPHRLLARRSLDGEPLQVGERVRVLVHQVYLLDQDRIQLVNRIQTDRKEQEWENEKVV